MFRASVAPQMRFRFSKRVALFAALLVLGMASLITYISHTLGAAEQATATVTTPWETNASKQGGKRAVSELEFPATLALRVDATVTALEGGETPREDRSRLRLNQPADTASIGNRFYVLDSGNGRLVEFDASGKAVRPLDASLDEQMALHMPMAMAVHDERLYIADSGSHRVVIVRPNDGRVEKAITLSRFDGDAEAPRPIGIAVATSGDILVSDAENQRVVRVESDGRVASLVGTGKRDSGNFGLNTPGGLAFDRQGNLYVVDILNSRVMKYSATGEFLLQIGQRGDTAGTFSRPKGIAIDDRGNVYVSDSLQAAVQVFDADAKYLGLIGRKEAGNKDSDSVFSAPAELEIVDGKLYVTDRLAGLFVFNLH